MARRTREKLTFGERYNLEAPVNGIDYFTVEEGREDGRIWIVCRKDDLGSDEIVEIWDASPKLCEELVDEHFGILVRLPEAK